MRAADGPWQGGAVRSPLVRTATGDDVRAIGAVALATGQDEEWGGTDPAYVRHLMAHGRVVVAEDDGVVTGFGATRRIDASDGPISMLCDLFVEPRSHGLGAGRAMLAELWRDAPRRMTFSSLHANALPLYTRFGLDAWWPLLYLSGDVRALRAATGWAAEPSAPGEVAGLEARWTGVDRSADHLAWAARPGGQPVVARHDGEAMATGTVAGAGADCGLVHLVVAPGAGAHDVADAVLTVLASLEPAGGRARVHLPAPHPATRALLAAGWRNEEFDLFMATATDLLDPCRAVPSPALA